jgi:putative DNA primase/helicase
MQRSALTQTRDDDFPAGHDPAVCGILDENDLCPACAEERTKHRNSSSMKSTQANVDRNGHTHKAVHLDENGDNDEPPLSLLEDVETPFEEPEVWREERERERADRGDYYQAVKDKATEPPPEDGKEDKPKIRLSDRGNALRLVERHGNILRHCHLRKRWLVWDGRRWKDDDTSVAMHWAKETVDSGIDKAAREHAAIIKAIQQADDATKQLLQKNLKKAEKELAWLLKSEDCARLKAMLFLAASDVPIPILPDALDRDAMLLNCPNGTLDLRTGKLREHRQDDYITKLCPVSYHPEAACPVFENAVRQIFSVKDASGKWVPDLELVGFFYKLLGLFLTGDVSEDLLIIFHGIGSNGKTLILELIEELLGEDYFVQCPPDLILQKRNDGHPCERAILHGKRVAVCSETPQGRSLNESLVKDLTGRGTITARGMKENFWSFRPTFKLVIATNHKPVINGDDDGIWRRPRLMPFDVQFWDPDKIPLAEQAHLDPALRADKKLIEKLRAELPGILALAVLSCLEWQEDGLGMPERVKIATSDYRQSEDKYQRFINDCCILGPKDAHNAGATDLYEAMKLWCDSNGERPPKQKTFGEAMTKKNFERYPCDGVRYRGIELTQDMLSKLTEKRNKPPAR